MAARGRGQPALCCITAALADMCVRFERRLGDGAAAGSWGWRGAGPQWRRAPACYGR